MNGIEDVQTLEGMYSRIQKSTATLDNAYTYRPIFPVEEYVFDTDLQFMTPYSDFMLNLNERSAKYPCWKA